MAKKNDKELAYYVTLFKIEGHTTWRVQIHPDVGGFARETAKATKMPKITDKLIYRIDRITGEISK